MTLSCCAEASSVCKDRHALGRGWVRWLSCGLACMLGSESGVGFVRERAAHYPCLVAGGSQFFCMLQHHMPLFGGSFDMNRCCCVKPLHGTTNYRSRPTETLVSTLFGAESAHLRGEFSTKKSFFFSSGRKIPMSCVAQWHCVGRC